MLKERRRWLNLLRISKMFVAFTLLIAIVVSAFAAVNMAWAGNGCVCEPGTVHYLGKDIVTKGDWQNAVGSPIGVYGSYAHILPNPPRKLLEIPVGNFSVPVGGFTYTDYGWTPNQISGLPFNRTDPTYWDEYVSLDPKINYTLKGTLYNMPGIGLIQYPVFAWAWDEFNSSDPRAAHFKTHVVDAGGPGTRLTCWDDGSERGFPSDGYFNVTLEFPKGNFMLSLYAYDKSIAGRPNQTFYITNEIGEILASAEMRDLEFDGGIYHSFVVCGPTTIIVHVKKGPASINAILSGIFVDKLRCTWRCCKTMGFWKTNLGKLLGYIIGKPQVRRADMELYIAFAKTRCPQVFGGLNSLADAYNVFKHYSLSMQNKAKAQLLALLFNVASGKASESDIVAPYLMYMLKYKYPHLKLSDYPPTVKDVIDTSCSSIMSGTALEFTKDICETLNIGYKAMIY